MISRPFHGTNNIFCHSGLIEYEFTILRSFLIFFGIIIFPFLWLKHCRSKLENCNIRKKCWVIQFRKYVFVQEKFYVRKKLRLFLKCGGAKTRTVTSYIYLHAYCLHKHDSERSYEWLCIELWCMLLSANPNQKVSS